MPAIFVCGHLINWLFEIGPAGQGQSPISHGDISAWQHTTGQSCSAWEALTLRKLSAEYINQSLQSKQLDCPPPWEPAGISNREVVTSKVQNAFRALMKKR